MKLKECDTVLLKDGRSAAIVDLPCADAETMMVDVGCSEKSWDTIVISRDMIERVLTPEEADIFQKRELEAEQAGLKAP